MPSTRDSDRRGRDLKQLAALLAGAGIGIVLGLTFDYMSRDTAFGLASGAITFVVLYLVWMWWHDRRNGA